MVPASSTTEVLPPDCQTAKGARGRKQPHHLGMADPRYGFEASLGGLGIEVEHHGGGAGCESSLDLRVAGMRLALHDDLLDAEACSDSERLDAISRLTVKECDLPSDQEPVGGGGEDEEQSQPGPDRLARRDQGHFVVRMAAPFQRGQHDRMAPARRHNGARKQAIGRPVPALTPQWPHRSHEASSTIQRTSSAKERPL